MNTSSDRLMSSDRHNQISEESLPTYVEELRSLGRSLGTSASRDKSSNQLREGLQLLSASIRAKTRMISNDADSSKARTRLRRLREGEKKKMVNLIRAYERLTGVAIQVDQAASGVFPWDVQDGEGHDLHSKRALCDLYMRHMRTKEELPILSEEISRLKASQEERLAYLKDQVVTIVNLLTTQRPAGRPGECL